MPAPPDSAPDLREAFIAAARAQLERDGADALNLRALAREIGVTHPAAYRHFADKEALLEAVAERGFDELSRRLVDALEAAGPEARRALEPRLRALATAYVAFTVANPALSRAMFARVSVDARGRNERLYAAAKRTYGLLLDSVEGAGGERFVDGAVAWALFQGLAQLIGERQLAILDDPAQRAAVVTRAVEVLARGLR